MPCVIIGHEILIRHPGFLLDHDRAFHDLAETGACGGGIAGGEGGVELHSFELGSYCGLCASGEAAQLSVYQIKVGFAVLAAALVFGHRAANGGWV